MPTEQSPPVSAVQTLWHSFARFVPALLIFAFLVLRYVQTHRTRAPHQVDLASLHLVDLEGQPFPSAQLNGKALILNFWAPWCPPCRIETPWLQHVQASHPKDLLVIGIVADSSQYPQSQAFMASHKATYLLGRETSNLDRILGTTDALPTTYYIDPTGRVLHSATGLIPEPLMQHFANDLTRSTH